MQNKATIVVGLVAVVLAIVGPPFVALSARPYEPPLRVGMGEDEADSALRQSYIKMLPVGFCSIGLKPLNERDYVEPLVYFAETDFLGNSHSVEVKVDKNRKVRSWEIKPRSRTRPPWLATTLKWVGW